MKARLEVICGPMFSGKTEELLRRLRREEVAGNSVILFKPQIDTRYDPESVVTHSGATMMSRNIVWTSDLEERVEGFDVVGIDEAQFLDDQLPFYINNLLKNRKFIISGLDKDFTTADFGSIPRLMVLADKVDKLTAVCNKCGADDASFTQRLVNGEPAKFDGPTILVGGTEQYEARCRECFEEG